MSDIAIRVEGLGKQYRIGGAQGPGRARYKSLRESLSNGALGPFRAIRSLVSGNGAPRGPKYETIWALKDVSFEVKRGEAVGVIGRNGAGKSTLLKILSRITEPTGGRAEVHGRVGSLLEVGTGFHPELTGRENIYLNGAILGMKRAEIDRKFDEIVDFSEIEKFLDTPVKYYSTGMHMRLAFSVAAHLDPEILLVDEVLAVGDASFQKKCLGKMGDVATGGRTVLFVSHNMAAVQNLCQTAIQLNGGELVSRGPTLSVVKQYLRDLQSSAEQPLAGNKNRRGRGRVRFTAFRLEDGHGRPTSEGISGEPLSFAADYRSGGQGNLKGCRVSFSVSDAFGSVLFLCSSELTMKDSLDLAPNGTVRCLIPRLPLSRGRYTIAPFLEVNREIEDWLIDGGAALDVVDGDFYGTGRLYPPGWEGRGVLVSHEWQTWQTNDLPSVVGGCDEVTIQ